MSLPPPFRLVATCRSNELRARRFLAVTLEPPTIAASDGYVIDAPCRYCSFLFHQQARPLDSGIRVRGGGHGPAWAGNKGHHSLDIGQGGAGGEPGSFFSCLAERSGTFSSSRTRQSRQGALGSRQGRCSCRLEPGLPAAHWAAPPGSALPHSPDLGPAEIGAAESTRALWAVRRG